MANKFDKGMDDAFLGKEINGDPGIEYLQGYGYAESLYEEPFPEQVDDRRQEQEEQENEVRLFVNREYVTDCTIHMNKQEKQK
jgi:hypothetical protein